MRIAFLVVDDRFDRPQPVPFFGSAPTALLQGFAALASPCSNEGQIPVLAEGRPGSAMREHTTSIQHLLPAGDIPEIHVICCGSKKIPAPPKLAENIFYHQIILPKWSYLRMLHSGPAIAVRRKLMEIGPDIVHAQGTERWCAFSALFSSVPRVLTIHGNLRLINRVTPMEPRAYWKLQEMLETFSIPRFDGVVCITNYTERNVADLAKKTWVVPNAVDQAFFSLGEDKNFGIGVPPEPKNPKILFVGHIQPRKNQNAFIDALAPLAAETSFRLSFFGGAARGVPYCDDFFARVESFSWCHYGGTLGRVELREEFRDASLLVLPSLEDNCPMVVLEAMASGVPVIAPNVGGVPDLIRDGENGLLIDPASSDSMRSAVKRLLGDRKFATELAVQARKDAEEKYHPRVIAMEHVKIYEEVVRSKK